MTEDPRQMIKNRIFIKRSRIRANIFLIVFCFSSSVIGLWSCPAYAGIHGDIRQGNKFFEQEDFEKAHEKYQQALQKSPESDKINFNAGTAAYKLGDFDKAMTHFQKALLSEDPDLKERAHYNLGNTFYRLAEKLGPKNPQQAVSPLEKSLAQYEEALKIAQDDQDAKFNYDFVKKVLEKVKEQIKKQKQQCNNPKNKKGDQKKKSQGQQGQQDKQQQSQQDQQQQQSQQDQKKQQGQQEKKENEEQGAENEGQKQGEQQDQSAGDQRQEGGQQAQQQQGQQKKEDLSQRQARMRLNDYEHNEAPQGMLNLRRQFDQRPVLKDW